MRSKKYELAQSKTRTIVAIVWFVVWFAVSPVIVLLTGIEEPGIAILVGLPFGFTAMMGAMLILENR